MKNADESTKMFGLSVFSSRKVELLKYLGNHLKSGKSLLTVFTPNPEQIVLTRENPKFHQTLTQADILLPDGVGLIWAGRILAWKAKTSAPVERIAGVEVVAALVSQLQAGRQRGLVIGGRDYGPDLSSASSPSVTDVVELAPGLWWTPGFADSYHPTTSELAAVDASVQQIKPEIVFVALGAPVQEFWISENRVLLEKNGVRIAMAVGGSFDMLLGKLNRAPKWMRQSGLEWLYRLAQEPWRWRRQLRLLKFIGITLQELIS